MRYLIVLVLAIFLGIGVWYVRFFHAPRYISLESSSSTPIPSPAPTGQFSIVAENLDTPWALAFLPGGDMLITERPGRVRIVTNGRLSSKPVWTVPQIKEFGEGGLLGITADPKFSDNHFVYLYYTYNASSTTVYNRVVKMTYENSVLSNEQVLVNAIPSSSNHNGGQIKFGPEGYLYVTTGDAESPSQAQDKNTLNGKILRMTTDGKPAPGNPFNTLIYSYGHRNPEGLAWDTAGNLWETEHGRSIPVSGLDELNIINSGQNYGWPIIQGNQTAPGMQRPILNSGSTTWAPAGMVFLNGSLFFGGLKGQAVYEAVLDGTKVKEVTAHLQRKFGRIRDVEVGPDGFLYITTSNNDSRGTPQAGDDKILKINPNYLNSL
jgi:glucose/arabinose dehydrogenase